MLFISAIKTKVLVCVIGTIIGVHLYYDDVWNELNFHKLHNQYCLPVFSIFLMEALVFEVFNIFLLEALAFTLC